MWAKKNRVAWDTCLQITDAGRRRLRKMEHRRVLRSILKLSPMHDAVFSILNRMDNGDIVTVKQLVDFQDKGSNLDYSMIVPRMSMFAEKRVVPFWAINRCIKKGYLVRVPAPPGQESLGESNHPKKD